MSIVAKETWERKYQIFQILSLLATVIVNYICKTCSGEGFFQTHQFLYFIYPLIYVFKIFVMHLLDISFFFVLQKQSVLVRANECLTIHTHSQTCQKLCHYYTVTLTTPSERMSILSFPLATVSLCECCVLSSV